VRLSAIHSDLLRYILENGYKPGDLLPTIQEISRAGGVSVAKTREDLEIARSLGIVEVKPGRCTRVQEYRFAPIATLSSLYAVGQDSRNFEHLRRMRNALETTFWNSAVRELTADDLKALYAIITSANQKLSRQPIEVPAAEHRSFHMTLFSRLQNPFVSGVLEAFWEVYEAFGLNLYFELDYHRQVWDYHARIVKAIQAGDIDGSRQLLNDHMNLLAVRSQHNAAASQSRFE
jgi:DNA-binding FadR family transcriptional regulator